MDIFYVTLPIVAVKPPLMYKILLWSGIVLLLFGCWSAFSLTHPYIFFACLALALLCFLATNLIKVYEVEGAIRLMADAVIVTTAAGACEYRIAAMQQLDLSLVEIRGERIGWRSMASKSGLGNSLSFQYNGTACKFSFLLEYDNVSPLSAMLQVWRMYHVQFTLDNRTSERF